MSTWKTKIEDITGSVGNDTFITNVCSESLEEVMTAIDDKHLKSLTVEESTDDSNPISLPDGNNRLLDVFREDGLDGRFRECKEVPLYLEARIQDGGSIYSASKTEPLFVQKSGNLHVYPAPSANNGVKLYYIKIDIPISYSDDYTNQPVNFNNALKVPILYKAIQKTLTKLILDLISQFPSNPFSSLPSPPAPPEELSFGTIGDLDISSLSLPVFVPPSLSLSYSNIDTALGDEDEDMVNAHVVKLNTQMAEFEKRMNESMQQFEESKFIYEKQFEELVHNSDKSIDKEEKEFTNKLEVFSKEMEVYSSNIEKEIDYFKELITKEKDKYTIYKETLEVYKEMYTEALKPLLPEDREEQE